MMFRCLIVLYALYVSQSHAKIFPQPPPSCAVSYYNTNAFTNLTILTNDDPLAQLEAPAISGMNGTTWDYWYFDGTDTNNPKAGIVVAFWRSAPMGNIKQSPLRVDVYATDKDGRAFKNETYVEHSYVVTCHDQTYGVWNSSDGTTISFQIDSEFKEAVVEFDTRWMKGIYTIATDSKPRILNNEPLGSAKSELMMSPGFFWTEPIPLGNVTVDIKLTGDAIPSLQLEGKGGHDRNWGTRLIPELADNWHFIRLWVGPFRFIYYQVTTNLWSSENVTYSSAILFEKDTVVFQNHVVPGQKITADDDFTTFNLTWGGPLEATNYNPSTGYAVDFVSPSRGKNWHFESYHTAMLYQLPPNPYEETAYRTNVGFGGANDEAWYYDGIGITQECEHLGAIPGQL